jgi:hypothetical protein
MIAASEYLVGFGKEGEFGRFAASEPLACRRGDRLIVATHRGLELGTVLRPIGSVPARLFLDCPAGRILRRPGADDLRLVQERDLLGQQLFRAARRQALRLGLSLEILDAELLLDGSQALVHFLGWAGCDVQPLAELLTGEYQIQVTLRDMSLPAAKADEEESCGSGSCGSGGCGSGGGCGSCSTGGGCGSCHSHAPEAAPSQEPLRKPLL